MGMTAIARSFAALLALGLAAACAAGPAPRGAGSDAPYAPLILIGLDGLRWDIPDRYPTPNLDAIAAEGVRAQGLVPVMPSKTFPNFYAVATGLYPEHSGVLNNETYDRALDVVWRTASAQDERWWLGEPIWITAEKQGLTAANFFWVGSEVAIDGVRPTYWYAYDEAISHETRVAQVLAWLDLPPGERPELITIYFDAIDTASHEFEIGSPEEAAAVASVDAAVGAIREGLAARGLADAANVVVVGDHGMVDIDPSRMIWLDDYFDVDRLKSPELADGRGNAVTVAFMGDAATIEDAYDAFALAHPMMRAYRRGQMPEHWRLDHPTRGPDLLLVPEPGWILSRRSVPLWEDYRATHGYEPTLRDMHAAFLATGPAFREGVVVEPFENVNVYALLAHLLGVEPAPNDGSLDVVEDMLDETP